MDFFKLVGAYAAQGALVIFRQLFAFIDITANDAYILFHNDFLQLILLI